MSDDVPFNYDPDNPESDWNRYMSSDCADYAVALQALAPNLSFGIISDSVDGSPIHVFVHDKNFAYDYAGKHLLPYHGEWADSICELNLSVEEIDERVGYIAESVNDCLPAIADHDRYGDLGISSIPWAVL